MRWLEAIVRACEDLSTMVDRDDTANVRIVPSTDGVIVEVWLADGRWASRRVRAPATLSTTLEALLAVPRAVRPPLAIPKASAPSSSEFPPAAESPQPPAPSPTSVRVEVGLDAGGRIAAGKYSAAALGIEGGIIAGAWLFGFMARWEVAHWSNVQNPAAYEVATFGTGVSVARRLAFGPVDLDLGFSPRVIQETQTYETSLGEQARAAVDLRFAPFARLAVGRAAIRFAVGTDFELSPGRLTRELRLEPGLPALPSWSAGLSGGLVWASP